MLLSQFGNNNNNFIIIMRNRSHLRSRIFWSCCFLIQMLLFIKEYSTEEECHRKYNEDCNFKLIRKQECTNYSSKHVSCAVAVFLKISTSDFVRFCMKVWNYLPWQRYPASWEWQRLPNHRHCWRQDRGWGRIEQFGEIVELSWNVLLEMCQQQRWSGQLMTQLNHRNRAKTVVLENFLQSSKISIQITVEITYRLLYLE